MEEALRTTDPQKHSPPQAMTKQEEAENALSEAMLQLGQGLERNRGPAPKVYWAILEGNIGAGKSSCLDTLKRFSQETNSDWFRVAPEPIQSFCRLDAPQDINLEEYYKSKSSVDKMLFQIKVVRCLLERQRLMFESAKNEGKDLVYLVERGLGSSLNFVEAQEADGLLQPRHAYQLKQLISEIMATLPAPDLSIYLNIAPEIALGRVHWRGREGETHITLGYLRNLQTSLQRHLGRPLHTVNITPDLTPHHVCAKIVAAMTHTLFPPTTHTNKAMNDGHQPGEEEDAGEKFAAVSNEHAV